MATTIMDTVTVNPQDAVNIRFGKRGWYYHITPGKFPHLMGGFAGTVTRGICDEDHRGREMGGHYVGSHANAQVYAGGCV